MNPTTAPDFLDARGEGQDNFKQVIEECNALLLCDPHCASAYNKRGAARVALGDLIGAVADFGEALRIHPGLVPAYCNRGGARVALGDLAGAVADFSEALSLNPHCLPAYRDRAITRYTLRDLDGAIADGKRAIQIDPRCIIAHRTLAEAYFAQGDFRAVIACCTEAIRIDPRCALAYNTRAGARLILKDFEGAILDCNEALRLDPRFCGAYVTRGNARYHKGDMGGVLDYRTAFALDSALAARGLVSLIADQLRHMGSRVFAECAEHLRENPKDAMSYARRGLTLLLQGKDTEAQKDFHQFRLLNPKGKHNLELLINEARQRRRK
ncbi:MAG TPA: tetratricopeptide repeat protein [Gemmataceae bacterium]|nr:tetratricopeptide repeat protein [Gemmataceae bacterium]